MSACSFIVLWFSLHVSAYMAIFRCVGYFHILEGFCFAAFSAFFSHGHSACFHVFFLCFPSFCAAIAAQKRQTTKTEQADKHTRKETTKITKENREKAQMETCRVLSLQKKQQSRILQA
jgi:hypothetical protein